MELYDGWKWREDRQYEYMAQMASWLTAPHLKRPMEPKKFLQKDVTNKKTTTPEKTKQVINELENLLGLEAS